MLEYMIDDFPEYKSRGERIMSVLNGSGSVDVLPGRPDVQASDSDFRKGEDYNPSLDFDPNSFSRIDKFDGLESGQEFIDDFLERQRSSSSAKLKKEDKKEDK